jgi:hypothetical protein
LSAVTPPTSSPTAPGGRSSTPQTSTTAPTGMTIARATIRRRTALGTRRRRSSRRSCAALSNFDFLSYDSSSSEEDEKVKCKQGDFTGLCLMGKSSRNISDSNFNVSDDLSLDSISLKVVELENALCNQ